MLGLGMGFVEREREREEKKIGKKRSSPRRVTRGERKKKRGDQIDNSHNKCESRSVVCKKGNGNFTLLILSRLLRVSYCVFLLLTII